MVLAMLLGMGLVGLREGGKVMGLHSLVQEAEQGLGERVQTGSDSLQVVVVAPQELPLLF